MRNPDKYKPDRYIIYHPLYDDPRYTADIDLEFYVAKTRSIDNNEKLQRVVKKLLTALKKEGLILEKRNVEHYD